MLGQIANTYRQYPRQFWLVAAGVLISSAGSSLIWPFQLIYISKTLGEPISAIATLISISSLAGLLVSLMGGSIADKIGRKPIMLAAQSAHGIAYLLMSRATTYAGFLLPMTIMGITMPLYAVGSDAMMADMLPAEERNQGYSILRMVNNAGIAIGPAIGGFIVTQSYAVAFFGAATGMIAYSLLLLFFTHETLPPNAVKTQAKSDPPGGFAQVLRDGHFLKFVSASVLGLIAPLLMWTLLALYTNQHYGLPEYLYSWLPITNALMCVFVQYFVTLLARRFPPLPVISFGMFIYAIGVGSIVLMSGFWGFWLSMVIITLGELIVIPNSSTYVANRAPEHLRGRYMSVYWLTWGLARAAAPTIGGYLHDQIAPQAIWWGGLGFGLISALGLFLLSRQATTEGQRRSNSFS
jgi:MFS family permease